MTTPQKRLAYELLASADALRECARQVDRLDRGGHPLVHGTDEATILHTSAPLVADAMLRLAARMAITKEAVDGTNPR